MTRSTYVVGIGSNRRGRHGSPTAEVAAALAALPGRLVVFASIIVTAPLGPSIRRFANTVAVIESDCAPGDLLRRLKAIERAFGRRRGQRWGARVIDLDILLWSGGSWAEPGLIIPHAALRTRDFVLGPLVRIVPGWRDPISGLTMRQLNARLTSRRALLRRSGAGAGP